MINIENQRFYSTLGFSLFFGWLLAIPFEGTILYTLIGDKNIYGLDHNIISISSHFIGLILAGFIVKSQVIAKTTAIVSIIVCLSGCLIFFLEFSLLWYISIVSISLFSALVVASWGFYYKEYSKGDERFKTAADILIYSNILMIFFNVIALNVSSLLALSVSIISLLCSLYILSRLESYSENETIKENTPENTKITIFKPMVFLCFFILIITINSGIMYQVVVPTFSDFKVLTSYYWAVPYILALLILRNTTNHINRAYILYIALSMIGLSYLCFMILNKSIGSYLIINSLMLGAFGVCDLFWWSMLGGFFDYHNNPARILGGGLSMNVLGVLIGGILGNYMTSNSDFINISILALFIVFMVIIILPFLNFYLTKHIKNNAYLVNISNSTKDEHEQLLRDFAELRQLTEREAEIVYLLFQGFTYKAISESLCISQNTTKFHVKNIYQKLNINSKMELIKMFTENAIK